METLKEFLAPKTFNRISYVAVLFWILFGVILLGIFAEMEISDSFRCAAESDKIDLVRGKCSEQYEKQYDKSGFPVYGFVIVNFFGIGFVCVIYSQVVKSKVDQQLAAIRRRDENLSTGRGLFLAYICQLVTRLTLGIVFVVLQTQLLYPANFPFDFHCQIPGGSEAVNASSAGNTTMYECYNQRAASKTFWTKAVSVINGIFAFVILIEIICILSRARKGRRFLEDWQFVKDHLPDHASPRVDPEPPQSSEPQQGRTVKVMQEEHEPQLPLEFIKSLKKSVVDSTKKHRDRKIDDIYTELVLIPNRAQYDFSANREKQLKVFTVSNRNFKSILEHIFKVKYQKILIVGRPGIGKTLFLTKLIRDWGFGKVLNHFEFAFFLKFRKFNFVGELSLRDLLSRSEYSQILSDEVWNHILTNPERVIIFFDGLNEFLDRSCVAERFHYEDGESPTHLSALFSNIVNGNLLPGASVVTTTRYNALPDVECPFFIVFEILGFASEQIEEYVEKFATDAPENVPDAGKKMLEYIKTNKNIFSLCYIPAKCQIVCWLLLQVLTFYSDSEKGLTHVLTGVLPLKFTEIYQKVLAIFLARHDEQPHNPSRPESAEYIQSPEEEEKIKPLAKLAFYGLSQKKLPFGQNEVPECLVNSPLFHKLPDHQPDPLTREAQYCFIHLTMQEFLAAKHISDTMTGKELRRFVADHINEGHWQLVFQFLAGLLGQQSIDIFADLLPEKTEKKDENELMDDDSGEQRTVTCWPSDSEKHLAVTLMKCINEGHESGLVVQSKLKIRFNAVDFSKCGLEPADCSAVVRFLPTRKQISLINLSYNNIGSLGCVEIVKFFDNAGFQLRSLNLAANNIGSKGAEVLRKCFVNKKLRRLNLAVNKIGDKGVEELGKGIVNNSKLRSLNLARNDIGDKGVEGLGKVLVNNNEVLSLNLRGNNIGDKGVEELGKGIVNNNKLRSLDLARNNIGDKGAKCLGEVLVNNNELSKLDLRGNNIGEESLYELCKVLANNNKLDRNNIGDKVVVELGEGSLNINKWQPE